MSSVPSEVLRDVLLPLDRWSLDDVQFTNRRFLRLIMERMSDVCLRQISTVTFVASNEDTDARTIILIDSRRERDTMNVHKDTIRLFSELMQALRSSHVAFMTLGGLVFTQELAALVLQTPIVAGVLTVHEGSCDELPPTQFHSLLLHFSPTSLDIATCHLRASHVTDEFLQELSKNRVRRITFPLGQAGKRWKLPPDG